jgi:hypothetical protein
VRADTVAKYKKLGILEEVPSHCINNHDGGIYHQFIVVTNKTEPRGCLSCTSINPYIPYQHFKLEGLHTVKDIVQKDDYIGSLDISKYYGHYAVHPEHRKYLRIVVDGKHYQYAGCPFGLSNLPFLVTKTLRPVLKHWRSKGIRCVNLLDDIKVMHQDEATCVAHMDYIEQHLESLGFIMNSAKRVQPEQHTDVFGLDLDTPTLTLEVPHKKRKDISQTAKRTLRSWEGGKLTIRKLAGFLGKLNFITPAWTAARTHSLLLIQAKNRELKRHQKRWDNLMPQIQEEEHAELQYIIDYVATAPPRCFLTRTEPQLTITGDASKQGYGAWTAEGHSVEGFWTRAEAAGSSNSRELRTGVLAVLALKQHILGLPKDEVGKIRVKYKSDNMVTCAILNRSFAKTVILQNIIQPLLDWSEHNGY